MIYENKNRSVRSVMQGLPGHEVAKLTCIAASIYSRPRMSKFSSHVAVSWEPFKVQMSIIGPESSKTKNLNLKTSFFLCSSGKFNFGQKSW